MNAYYDNFNHNISDSRIIEGYFEEVLPRESIQKKLRKALTSIVSSPAVRRFAKPVILALSLLSVCGVVGAIESGRMSVWSGLLVGGVFILAEALVLRIGKKRS